MYNYIMETPEFETLYKRLNTAQKKAVDTIEGPVMVIAGPGTGKTSILTLRIANILKKDGHVSGEYSCTHIHRIRCLCDAKEARKYHRYCWL